VQFARQVVRDEPREQVEFVAQPPADGHVVHLALRLELAEDALLAAAALSFKASVRSLSSVNLRLIHTSRDRLIPGTVCPLITLYVRFAGSV
jgi:hypothetical protein